MKWIITAFLFFSCSMMVPKTTFVYCSNVDNVKSCLEKQIGKEVKRVVRIERVDSGMYEVKYFE